MKKNIKILLIFLIFFVRIKKSIIIVNKINYTFLETLFIEDTF